MCVDVNLVLSVCVYPGDDKDARKGQVLTLLAEQALQCLDFKASYIHCQDLMAAGMELTEEEEEEEGCTEACRKNLSVRLYLICFNYYSITLAPLFLRQLRKPPLCEQ